MMLKLKNKNIIIPVLLFLFVFSLYIYTAPPEATNYADSNELITASYTLGLPHPPGYPLFLLIGKLFSFLPIGEIAFRYSVFCIFFGALTVVLVYLIIFKILKSIIAALIGALSLAFSYIFWLYSIVPEVFSLLNFFTALLIYFCVCWYQEVKHETEYPFLIALCAALGFLSQQLIVFLAPALFYIIFIIDKKIFLPSKRWLKIIPGFLLGFLPLIYFPLAALRKPVIDYGNTISLQKMWDYLTRRIYGEFTESGSAYLPAKFDLQLSLNQLSYYLKYLVNQFSLIFFLFGLTAILAIIIFLIKDLIKKRKDKNFELKFNHLEIFLLSAFILTGPLLSMYLTIDFSQVGYNVRGAHERMFIFSTVIFAILIGLGAKKILEIIRKINLSVPIVTVILISILVIPLKNNFKLVNKHDFHLGEDFAYNLFINMEPNAIFFTRGDMPSFAAYYYKYLKGERQDVTIIPFSLRDWAIENLKEREPNLWDTESKEFILIIRDIIQDNIDKRPIYFTGIPDSYITMFGLDVNPLLLNPRGLIAQAGRDFEPREEEDFWAKMKWRNSKNIDDYGDWYTKELFEQYVIGSYNSFLLYQKWGYYDLAEKELERLKGIDPNHPNLARAMKFFRLEGKKEREVRPFSLGTSQDYLEQGYKFLRKNQIGEAVGEFSMAKELEPENPLPRLQLAKTYELFGWSKEAIAEYREILKLDPNYQEAKERLMILEELSAP